MAKAMLLGDGDVLAFGFGGGGVWVLQCRPTRASPSLCLVGSSSCSRLSWMMRFAFIMTAFIIMGFIRRVIASAGTPPYAYTPVAPAKTKASMLHVDK